MNKQEIIENIYGEDFGETDIKKIRDYLNNIGYPSLAKIICRI